MSGFKTFEDIVAWQKARVLCNEVYRISNQGNFAKDFELRNQSRRAAISVLSNIAEGFERQTKKEFYQFLHIAKGSCGEMRAQSYVALDQNYITQEEFATLVKLMNDVINLLGGLIINIRKQIEHVSN